MMSIDSNILLYAYDELCPEHEKAFAFVMDQRENVDFVICEVALIEFYNLVRNPAVVENPLTAHEAVEVCERYRRNRKWLVIDYPGGLMGAIWQRAAARGFPRRGIYDARLALTLRHHGVTEFATRNVRHFQSYGFERVWDPL
jgi:toxin-antitoxin system PIN domain toxin